MKIGNDTDDTIFIDVVYADYGGAFSPFRYENSVQPKIHAVYGSSLLDFRAAFVADMAEPIEYRRQRRRRGPGDCYRFVLNMDLRICTLALPYVKIYRIQIFHSGCRQAFPCLGHGLDFLPFWLVWFMQRFCSRVQIKVDELAISWVPDSDSSLMPAPTTGSFVLLLSSDPVVSCLTFFAVGRRWCVPDLGFFERCYDDGGTDGKDGNDGGWYPHENNADDAFISDPLDAAPPCSDTVRSVVRVSPINSRYGHVPGFGLFDGVSADTDCTMAAFPLC